jgi:hypothetical protein
MSNIETQNNPETYNGLVVPELPKFKRTGKNARGKHPPKNLEELQDDAEVKLIAKTRKKGRPRKNDTELVGIQKIEDEAEEEKKKIGLYLRRKQYNDKYSQKYSKKREPFIELYKYYCGCKQIEDEAERKKVVLVKLLEIFEDRTFTEDELDSDDFLSNLILGLLLKID